MNTDPREVDALLAGARPRWTLRCHTPRVGSDQAPVRGWEKMQEDGEVLTAAEAAHLLRVSTKTVLTLARDGVLPGEKVGRAWRFVRGDLLEHLRGDNRRKATAS